jgi:Secretion system C-terminal sorting domain
MKKITLTICLSLLFLNLLKAQLSVVTSDLVSPAGVEVDNYGNAWVTETGTGMNDGRVLLVKPNGLKIPVIVNLPSAIDPGSGDTGGAWRTMQLGNNRLAVIIGEGPTDKFGRILIFNLRGFRPGHSRPKTDADAIASIEISSFAKAQPGVTNSNPFSAALDCYGNWYVADAGANMIIKVTRHGHKSVFAKFPPIPNPTPIGPPVIDYVPTKIIANPHGGFYVCNLSGFPFLDGNSSILSIDMHGNVRPYATGLTLLTDIVLDHRTGDLYALQFGSFKFPTPGFVFGSGKVHRISRGGRHREVVAENFGPGSGLDVNKRGDIYVTSLFTGQLLRQNNCHSPYLSGRNSEEEEDIVETESISFKTYPNPATDYLTVTWENPIFDTPQYVRLADMTGRVVYEKNVFDAGAISQRIDLRGYASGAYILQLKQESGVLTKKVIIDR